MKRLAWEHLTERRDHAMRLWALLCLEWWLRSERAQELIDRHEVGIAGPGVEYVREHPERVRRWISEGMRVRVWTVNTVEDALFLAGLGVQEMTSDYPARIRLALGNGQ